MLHYQTDSQMHQFFPKEREPLNATETHMALNWMTWDPQTRLWVTCVTGSCIHTQFQCVANEKYYSLLFLSLKYTAQDNPALVVTACTFPKTRT